MENKGKLIGYNFFMLDGTKEFVNLENEKAYIDTYKERIDYWQEVREHICAACGKKCFTVYSVSTFEQEITYDFSFVCKECFDKIKSENETKHAQLKKEQDEILADIEQRGIDVCRIKFYNENIKDNDIIKVLGDYMRKNKLYHLHKGHYVIVALYKYWWGNYCLCDVPVTIAEHLQKAFPQYNIVLDSYSHYIGRNELESYAKGDRVEVVQDTILGENSQRYTVLDACKFYMCLGKTKKSKKYICIEPLSQLKIKKV